MLLNKLVVFGMYERIDAYCDYIGTTASTMSGFAAWLVVAATDGKCENTDTPPTGFLKDNCAGGELFGEDSYVVN